MPVSLENLFQVQQQTKTPLQSLRDARRQRQADTMALETSRVQNELRRLQAGQIKAEMRADQELASAMAGGFTGGVPAEAPPAGLAGQQTGTEKSQQAQANLTKKLSENPQLIKNMRDMRDRLYGMGNPKAQDKAMKIDQIISNWEQRNYFKKKEATDIAAAEKATSTEGARAWAATPAADRPGRLAEFNEKYGADAQSVQEMDVWARDLMAGAKDITATGAAGKGPKTGAMVTTADKIRKNFDAEMVRYFPNITRDAETIKVDDSYDEMRKVYSATLEKMRQSGQPFDPAQAFAEIADTFVHVPKPNTAFGDGLSDMSVDVFIPRDFLELATSKNPELSADQVAVLYSKILEDKKRYGRVTAETNNLMIKNRLN